jgi:hypothetical protein
VSSLTSSRNALSAQDSFADGERIGYSPEARAILAAQDAPHEDFLEPRGRFRARRLLARISRWLVRAGEGSTAQRGAA